MCRFFVGRVAAFMRGAARLHGGAVQRRGVPGECPERRQLVAGRRVGAALSGVYAASIPGVLPTTTCISQLQAAQARALSQKHLIKNDEWHRAAAGTPDPGNADDGTITCVANSVNPANTGSRSACVSSWGAHDMVGNVRE